MSERIRPGKILSSFGEMIKKIDLKKGAQIGLATSLIATPACGFVIPPPHPVGETPGLVGTSLDDKIEAFEIKNDLLSVIDEFVSKTYLDEGVNFFEASFPDTDSKTRFWLSKNMNPFVFVGKRLLILRNDYTQQGKRLNGSQLFISTAELPDMLDKFDDKGAVKEDVSLDTYYQSTKNSIYTFFNVPDNIVWDFKVEQYASGSVPIVRAQGKDIQGRSITIESSRFGTSLNILYP